MNRFRLFGTFMVVVAIAAVGCSDAMQGAPSSENDVRTRNQMALPTVQHQFSKAPAPSSTGHGYEDWEVTAVETDANDAVYVAGELRPGGELNFGSSTSSMENPPRSGIDGFLVKFSKNGSFEWQKHFGSSKQFAIEPEEPEKEHEKVVYHYPVALATTPVSSGDPGSNNVVLGLSNNRYAPTTGISYQFGKIRQFDPSGSEKWSRTIGHSTAPSTENPTLVDIAVGPNDQLVVTGEHVSSFDVGEGSNSDTVTPRNDGIEVYSIAYDAYDETSVHEREHEWNMTFGGDSGSDDDNTNRVDNIAMDPNTGDFAIVGTYESEHKFYRSSGTRPAAPVIDPTQHGQNLYIQTFDRFGSSIDEVAGTNDPHPSWSGDDSMGGPGIPGAYVEFDSQGRLYLAGSFSGVIDGPLTGGTLITSGTYLSTRQSNTADVDAFVIRYPGTNSLGSNDFAYQTGLNEGNSVYDVEKARGLAVGQDWFSVVGKVQVTANGENSGSTSDTDGFAQVFDISQPADFPPYFSYYTRTYDTSGEVAWGNAVAFDSTDQMTVGGWNSRENYSLGGPTLPGGAGFIVSYTVN